MSAQPQKNPTNPSRRFIAGLSILPLVYVLPTMLLFSHWFGRAAGDAEEIKAVQIAIGCQNKIIADKAGIALPPLHELAERALVEMRMQESQPVFPRMEK